jgi:hypothetical protein
MGDGRRKAEEDEASILLKDARMTGMHSLSKGQREVVNDLVRKVLVCDMGSFTAERFKDWIKNLDNQFRKMGMTLQFEIRDRAVYFTMKELRTGRRIYHFASSTHVRFDADDVIMSYEEIARRS